ncbi:hypothetical protein ILYODFUR_020022, partial [Ilyodon furcidens]
AKPKLTELKSHQFSSRNSHQTTLPIITGNVCNLLSAFCRPPVSDNAAETLDPKSISVVLIYHY